MSYAIRITTHAVEVVTGSEDEVIVSAITSGAKGGLRSKWGGGEFRARGKMIRHGSGWTMDSNPGSPALGSGHGSYANTPLLQSFSPAASPYLASPSFNSPTIPSSNPGTPAIGASFPASSRPSSMYHSKTPSMSSGLAPTSAASLLLGSSSLGGADPPSITGTPLYSNFPLTPNPANGNGSGFPVSPPSKRIPSNDSGRRMIEGKINETVR
ncbi:hypothetical protein C8R42DRAFT_718784 [Lentinula raphanica]|nr:hypothetical protein C8R42DRAFT_718784 [Lentinula raphanica]